MSAHGGGRVLLQSISMSLLLAALGGGSPAAGAPTERRGAAPAALEKARIAARLLAAPMSFEPNLGQTDPRVRFVSRGPGRVLFLTPSEAVLALGGPERVLRMQLVGANPSPAAEGREPLPGRSHYYRGSDPASWRTDVPRYARVQYREVYPGVDLVFHGSGRHLEYDFIVAPSADPGGIALRLTGADRIAVDGEGDLVLSVGDGEVRHERPVAYQDHGGLRRAVAARYVLRGPGLVGFEVAAHDRRRPLVIDPILRYSTYLGGSDYDEIRAIAIDSTGNAYLTGLTRSTDFPTAGDGTATAGGGGDAFVARLDPAGNDLVFSTYLGGDGADAGNGVASDGFGAVTYVTGATASTNFPITSNAMDTGLAGDSDAFLASLDATGRVTYATYFGGDRSDWANAVAVGLGGPDEALTIVITGGTTSSNFPVMLGAIDLLASGPSDAFVSRFVGSELGGAFLAYSTYLGGSGQDEGNAIALGASGQVYVAGATDSDDFPRLNALQRRRKGPTDAFVARLNLDPAAPGLVYSTYLGGESDESASGIAVDLQGNAYVSGSTSSRRFPRTRGAFRTDLGLVDGFVSKLDPTGEDLVYSTLLGGSGEDRVTGIALGPGGTATVAGITASPDFPSTPGFELARGGSVDAFVTRLNASGTGVEYSVFLGIDDPTLDPARNTTAIAVDPVTGAAFAAGFTASDTLVTSPGSFQIQKSGSDDGFVMRIE